MHAAYVSHSSDLYHLNSFAEAREFILKEVANVPPADFHALFPTLTDEGKRDGETSSRCLMKERHVAIIGIDLLQRLLRFDPRQRPTAEEALRKFNYRSLTVYLDCPNPFRSPVPCRISRTRRRTDGTTHPGTS